MWWPSSKILWKRVVADVQLYTGLALIIGFSLFSVHQSGNAVKRADVKANAAQAAAAVAEASAQRVQQAVALCKYTVPSWTIFRQLILDGNVPSKLSPSIDPNSSFGRELQTQIDQANAMRAARQARELQENGPKPCQ